MNGTDRCSDNVFGPALSCQNIFDFTLLFEQSIIFIGPCAIFILLFPSQVYMTWRSTIKTVANRVFAGKVLACAALASLQLGIIVLWSKNTSIKTALPHAILNLLATLAVSSLVVLQHSRLIRPSSLVSLFLLLTALFDAVQIRSLFLRGVYNPIAAVLSAELALKLTLICLEAGNKRGYLKESYAGLPTETLSGIFNRSLFWWLHPTFWQGFRTGITIDSLNDIDITLKSEPIQKQILQEWKKQNSTNRFRLTWAVALTLRRPLLAVVLPRLCLIAFSYAQPFVIQQAISLLELNRSTKTIDYGHGLIGATAFIYLGIAISTALYQYKLCRSLTMVRSAIISLIYATALESPAGSSQDEARSVTLMSTDVDRIINGLEMMHETWARLLEIAIGLWLLTRQMGAISVAPIVATVLCFAWQTWLARYIGPRQLPWIQAIQSRIGKTSSVLRDIKAVKMMGLTNRIENMLQAQRVKELQLSTGFRWMIVWVNIIASMPQVLAPLVTFTAYAMQARIEENGVQLSPEKAFTSLAIVSLITNPTMNLLASIPALRVAEGCLDRVQKFLLIPHSHIDAEEPSPTHCSDNLTHDSTWNEMVNLETSANIRQETHLIRLTGAYLHRENDKESILKDVNLGIYASSHTLITGSVGSGKSTLLLTFLNEIKPKQGSAVVLAKNIGYCSQTPWLPNGSFRQVLCGPEAFEESWYGNVLYACSLQEVVEQLPNGNDSIIGSRGSILSGGQKQRLALARAVYARKNLLLLDDVFSALDEDTEAKIVERLLSPQGLLRRLGCTVVLATNMSSCVSSFDNIIYLDGKQRRAKVLNPDEMTEISDLTSCRFPLNQKKITDMGSGTPEKNTINAKNVIGGVSQEDIEDLARRTGDMSVYLYYYRSIGLLYTLATLLILGVFTFASNWPRIWIQWYTEGRNSTYGPFIGVYVMLVLVASVCQGAMIWQIMIKIVPKSGAKLHKILLRIVMHAPMPYLSTVDFGVILNRFSQDMTLVDAILPTAAFGTFLALLQCIAQLIFIALGSNYMALCIPITIVTVYFIQKVYLRTSRQLRFLDLEAKSPLFTHFVETMEGLASIRAFGWQASSVTTNLRCLDRSQKPFYMLLCIQRWLALVLDLTVAAIAITTVTLALSLRDSTNGGSLGVALTAILSFSQALQSLMLSWTQMETSLGAIARTKNLETAVPPEDVADEVHEPPRRWPTEGVIEFRNVSVSYNDQKLALRNVSFHVKAKQKIGIIGRSGSGKSTLISTLLRLVDIAPTDVHGSASTAGQVLIDGISIAMVPRLTLRSRILSVPQEALTLPGASIRFNANPYTTDDDTCRDGLIISSLTKVGLWPLLEGRGGLDEIMTSESLSEGEAQLFAIARTLIFKSISTSSFNADSTIDFRPQKVLLLDEATSHLDAQTDARIQRLIRAEFADFTIITIAHRIDSIRDSDMLGVMENGELLQYGRPDQILRNPNSFIED